MGDDCWLPRCRGYRMIDDARDKSAALAPDTDAAGRQSAAAPTRDARSAPLAGVPQLPPAASTTPATAPGADRSLRGAAGGANSEHGGVPHDDVPDVAAPDAALESGVRGGADARRRGWFWHWNSIVT